MTIKFKCSCGHELRVPDDSAGREALCPNCRKKVPVPGAGGLDVSGRPDEREASEFKPGALASLLDGYSPAEAGRAGEKQVLHHEQRVEEAPAAAPGPAAPEAEEPKPEVESEKMGKPRPAEDEKPAGGGEPVLAEVRPADDTQPVPPPGVEVFPGKIKFRCECGQKVAVKIPAPHSAGKCPRCGRKLKVPSVPGLDTKARAPAESGRKPGKSPGGEFKHCPKCGRRIEDSGAAFCPRCGFPLSLIPPGAGGGGSPPAKREKGAAGPRPNAAAEEDRGQEPGGSAQGLGPQAEVREAKAVPVPGRAGKREDAAEIRKRSARQAADHAADRLRPRSDRSDPSDGSAAASRVGTEPAGLGRRLGAFAFDCLAVSAVALAAWHLGRRFGTEQFAPAAGLVGLGAFALLNDVVFAALAGGRSLGMVAAGVGVVNSEGRPAGLPLLLARFLATGILFVGAPLAVFDRQRRTLHDLVCGTTVRQLARA